MVFLEPKLLFRSEDRQTGENTKDSLNSWALIFRIRTLTIGIEVKPII